MLFAESKTRFLILGTEAKMGCSPRPAHGPLGWISEKFCGIFVANSADYAGFAGFAD
jgi:hypothetical protein